MMVQGIIGVVVLSVLMSTGAAWAEGSPGKSLYERLGGKEAITAVVDTFVGNVGGDKRINGYFASTDLAKLKMGLVNQICEASGGPCKYTGRSMKQTHAGMGVTNAAFDALVEDLIKALDHHKVGKGEKDELLAVLGPMRSDIVEKK
jgi:hemoglobin